MNGQIPLSIRCQRLRACAVQRNARTRLSYWIGNILPIQTAQYPVAISSDRRVRDAAMMTDNLRVNERVALDLIAVLLACVMIQSVEVGVNLANQYPVFGFYRAGLLGIV